MSATVPTVTAATTTATSTPPANEPDVKTFRGESLEELLPQIREELGADAALQTLALAHDHRVGTELLADLRQQLVEIAAAIGPRLVIGHGAHASTTPIVSTRIPGTISL